jgi:hypothetical protein
LQLYLKKQLGVKNKMNEIGLGCLEVNVPTAYIDDNLIPDAQKSEELQNPSRGYQIFREETPRMLKALDEGKPCGICQGDCCIPTNHAEELEMDKITFRRCSKALFPKKAVA